MSSPTPDPVPDRRRWLDRSVVILLILQVGLLWTHGSMLQRQHDDLLALREDVQDLADSLDQEDDQQDWDTTGARPARTRPGRRGHRLVRARQAVPAADPDSGDRTATQELDAVRRSGQEAVAKARDTRAKLSIPENVRLADVRAAQAAREDRRPWLWTGAAVLLAMLGARAVLRRRG